MKDRIEAFLGELDDFLFVQAGGQTLDLYPIGRSALVWQYGYAVTTQDIDVLLPAGSSELVNQALAQFGRGKRKALHHGLYLEFVSAGLPPVPHGYKTRATRVEGPWNVLRVYYLDPHDLAATKLKRFLTRDREDIRLLCDSNLLDPRRLEGSLEQAFIWSTEKDGDVDREEAFKNLHTVQAYICGEINEF